MISVIIENWIRTSSSTLVSVSLVGRREWLLSSRLKPASVSSRSCSTPLREIAFGLAPHVNFHGNQSRHVCTEEERSKKKKKKEKEEHTLKIIQSWGRPA